MSSISSNEDLIIREFTSHKQIKLFKSLQSSRITGKLSLINLQKGLEWSIYLYLGQIIYATGGEHPFRRWQRSLTIHLPERPFNLIALERELDEQIESFGNTLWEYDKLFALVRDQEITRQQASNIIWFMVTEVMFDITQGREVICTLERNSGLYPLLDLMEPLKAIEHVDSLWQSWQQAKIADRSPNLAPVILQPKQLQEKISNSIYENICRLLDNSKTLRDLAIHLKASPLDVTTALLPHIQSGVLDLVSVPDLLNPDEPRSHISPLIYRKPLIACVDDSHMMSYMMEQIISVAGYRFLGINDPIQAISSLREKQPDLILLDVVMPELNGYELCTQLKKIPELTNTPIIFLASNDGLVDRFKAKKAGAVDFIKKNVDPDRLIKIIMQYLPALEE